MRKACCLLLLLSCAALGASVGGPVSPSGVPAQVPVPASMHLRNKTGTDRQGLCVFTSIDLDATWQNVPALMGFRDWMTRYPGGGYPRKVDDMVARICKERGVEKPLYLQVEGDDLAILELACKTGRPAAITYGKSPTGRYGGQWIAHMVTLSHARGDEWAVIDNNYPGSWEWMSRAEFQKAYSSLGRPRRPGQPKDQGWTVILLAPPAPPAPVDDLPPAPR